MHITDLTAGYGKLTILHEINLSVAAQRFTAILGPNGSGKSTLLKSVFGMTTITGGSVKVDGLELVGLPTNKIGQWGIAYVPQRSNVFTSMTVRENLLLALRNKKRTQSHSALEAAYDVFPILQKRQGQKTAQLSGGERQMVAIAMAWLTKPRIMLLDEPSAGLAPVLANEVFKVLKSLREQDLTLVVVEQNARRVLAWCDDVYVLREGAVAFSGTAAECLADPETVKEYLGVGVGKRMDAIRERRKSAAR